ncbi:(3S)-malyl-CoA thioesterase [Roseivivax sp. THAF40]|uniref:HpcH/HpaI aldolase/citrate lyase family protein n=1 Tax=unclassified Roseivivax TaxID=2639302 RepID=UPI0012687942|nr:MULTISPECIES: CoA ester lyase [unclassified Roseivivax]QFS81467.1 (3S)-malyl-CoA thioesterase [Roseivivax sp. THAF197b]QFT45196.1 (3S)-malyl-CoA thioesterase [Roseivivax sp. THAF40]
MISRPYRSVLYIPGSKPRAIDKARGLPVDAIIFDLEDAVSPEEKASARDTLAEELAKGGFGARFKMVRINGLDTEWGEADARAAATMQADAVLVPKVGSATRLNEVSTLTGNARLWAMMETPTGILHASSIAAHPLLDGFVMGTNDLAKELRSRSTPDRLAMLPALGHCLLAARAHGIAIVDGVYNAFKDNEGLAAECRQGRDMGFDGKTLIHPAQVEIANAEFGPSEAELDLARRQIEAYEAAKASGQGVAVVDGKIVENLHVDTAQSLLAQAEAIAAIAKG